MEEEYKRVKEEKNKYYKKHKHNLLIGGIALGCVAVFGSFTFPIGIIYDYLVDSGVGGELATNISFITQIVLVIISGLVFVGNTVFSYVNSGKMVELDNKEEELINNLFEENRKLYFKNIALENSGEKEKEIVIEEEKVEDKKVEEKSKEDKVVDNNDEVLDLSDEKLLELINDPKNEQQSLRLKTLYHTLNAIDKNGKFSDEEKIEQKNKLRTRIYDMATGKQKVKTYTKKKVKK